MAKVRQLPARPFRELFLLGKEIGAEHVLLNDAELGIVLSGGDSAAFAPESIANMRSNGRLRVPVVRIGKQPRTRLSDALKEISRLTQSAA